MRMGEHIEDVQSRHERIMEMWGQLAAVPEIAAALNVARSTPYHHIQKKCKCVTGWSHHIDVSRLSKVRR